MNTSASNPLVFKTKSEVRDFAKGFRSSLTDRERAEADLALAFRLIDLPEFLTATTILTYAATIEEISPVLAFDLLKVIIGVHAASVAYPRVIGVRDLEARIATPDDLEVGTFGIREPSARAPLVTPDRIDLVLVPGIAFDRRGSRIGYGGGYYDTYLPELDERTITIGLSYDETVFDLLPLEPHDRSVDIVVTPNTLYRG
ncbi:MAG: 5-formyltetrahydrofolate cyclo-ligase [Coriobacteriia bacterium]|nr:5-formyltetrahydrofolate cyclo-ligase [Coriobacteriia bacterium]